jgi:hypothetical protein
MKAEITSNKTAFDLICIAIPPIQNTVFYIAALSFEILITGVL